jgi:hypothetical protein
MIRVEQEEQLPVLKRSVRCSTLACLPFPAGLSVLHMMTAATQALQRLEFSN